MATSVNEVKQLIDYISRKNNSATLNPEQLNLILHRAQMTKFMILYGNPTEYQVDKPVPRIAYEVTQKISDDLRAFKKQPNVILDSAGHLALPSDYVHLISLRYKTGTNVSGVVVPKYIDIKIVDEDKEYYRLGSTIVPPTKKHPIGVLKSNYVQIYPTNITTVQLSYLSQPPKPVWGYTMVNNRPVFNSATSVDLLWPDVVINDIVILALSYVGISIKDGDLSQYTQIQKQQGQ